MNNPAGLTERERQVLECLAEGLSYKEAGRRLGISNRTIEVHVYRITHKVTSRIGLSKGAVLRYWLECRLSEALAAVASLEAALAASPAYDAALAATLAHTKATLAASGRQARDSEAL